MNENIQPSNIDWPEDLHPLRSPVYSRNELEIDAPPEVVWAWLVRATGWQEWYANSKNLRLIDTDSSVLNEGTEFAWTTFNVPVKTKVYDFDPPRRLSWIGKGLGAKGFHSWVIEPTPNGCKVVTEEVQKGIVPSIARYFFKRMLHKQHQIWLEGLARVAQRGMPE